MTQTNKRIYTKKVSWSYPMEIMDFAEKVVGNTAAKAFNTCRKRD